MKIRALPPAAAPLGWKDVAHGVAGLLARNRAVCARAEEIREHFGVRHAFLVSSGSAALTITLKALASVDPRRRVVIPAYTCFSVPAAVLAAGLQPVLCDIDVSTFDFDHDPLERALDDDTLCVIAHHLFGIPSDVGRIRTLCASRGIFVIEDAAQAMGVESNGRKLGTCGDAGIFSLGRGKHLTCGSGGIIVTSSDAIGQAVGEQYRSLVEPSACDMLKQFAHVVLMAAFIHPRLFWIPAALPFLRLGETIFPKRIPLKRLSRMQAGLLRDWRARLGRSSEIRSRTAGDIMRRLGSLEPPARAHPYLRLPIAAATSEEKRRILRLSRRRRLGMSAAYPSPINEIPELRGVFNGQRFPAARQVAETLLTIPVHQWVSETDKHAIAAVLACAFVPDGDDRRHVSFWSPRRCV
jgi:perosamine synthetase